MFEIIIGIVNGEHFVGPLSIMALCCFSKVSKPPAPEPTITPILYGSSFDMSILESFIASSAATQANWANLSIRFLSFTSSKLFCSTSSSKVVTSPPKVTK